LLFFLLDQGEPVRRRAILEAVWPEKDARLADDEFRRTRSEVKKLIGRPWLEQKDGRWQVTLPYWLDVHEFERLAHEGERLAHQGEINAAAATLRQALDQWSGGFLEGADNEWVELRREDLEHRRLDVVERLAELEIALRRYAEAAPLCREVLEKDPYRES